MSLPAFGGAAHRRSSGISGEHMWGRAGLPQVWKKPRQVILTREKNPRPPSRALKGGALSHDAPILTGHGYRICRAGRALSELHILAYGLHEKGHESARRVRLIRGRGS